VAASVALLAVLAGCSADGSPDPAPGTFDCAERIRFEGVTYSGRGYTEHDATRFAVADRAECHDTGPTPDGSVFEDDPEQVATWSFDDYPTQEVLAVRFDKGSFTVFVAETIPEGRAEEILADLGRR
jgi:hypothetical protein